MRIRFSGVQSRFGTGVAEKPATPLPPTGIEGEHFGKSPRDMTFIMCDLQINQGKDKAKQLLRNPTLFVTF
jgi:hypothetical protein